MSGPRIERSETGIRLTVRVQPRASRSELAGVHGDALKIRLTAPPVDGAANDALIKFLADTFGVPRRDITILSGAASRTKVVHMHGVTEDSVRRVLG